MNTVHALHYRVSLHITSMVSSNSCSSIRCHLQLYRCSLMFICVSCQVCISVHVAITSLINWVTDTICFLIKPFYFNSLKLIPIQYRILTYMEGARREAINRNFGKTAVLKRYTRMMINIYFFAKKNYAIDFTLNMMLSLLSAVMQTPLYNSPKAAARPCSSWHVVLYNRGLHDHGNASTKHWARSWLLSLLHS